ncbi:MAG: hypothetical protein R6V58_18280 [Planctomycetota bacterium]
MIYEDALPGLGRTVSLEIDERDGLYALMVARPMFGETPYFNNVALTLVRGTPKQTRFLTPGSKGVPLPLPRRQWPDRPPDFAGRGKGWAEHADWIHGACGIETKSLYAIDCSCGRGNSQAALDYFAGSFVPETDHYSIVALDRAGNVILRAGQYGNVDDGVPIVRDGGSPAARSIGGDELALVHPCGIAVHTDRRLVVTDVGNARLVSVRLGYHATETVRLKDVRDRTGE